MTEIPLFPLGNTLFPDGVMHLRVFEVRYLDMIRRCIAEETGFGVLGLLSGGEVRSPQERPELAPVGTLARIRDWKAPMPALITLSCAGTTRFRLLGCREAKYGLWLGEVEMLPAPPVLPVPEALRPAADALGQLIAGLQREGLTAQAMPLAPPFRLDESGWVADRWCELLPLPAAEKARLLALDDPVERLRCVQAALAQP